MFSTVGWETLLIGRLAERLRIFDLRIFGAPNPRGGAHFEQP